MKTAVRQLSASALLLAISALPSTVLAASASAFASLDFISISTTGSATATLTGSPFDVFSALAGTTGGIADGANDGAFFESFAGPFGEGTATQGPGSASSFAISAIDPGMAASMTTTFQELELELSGVGDVFIEIGYTLEADIVDSLADGFAEAGISAFTGFEGPETAFVGVAGGTPFDFAGDISTLFIGFFFDDLGSPFPVTEFLSIETFATVKASAVPVPAAVWLMGSALLGMAGIQRRDTA